MLINVHHFVFLRVFRVELELWSDYVISVIDYYLIELIYMHNILRRKVDIS